MKVSIRISHLGWWSISSEFFEIPRLVIPHSWSKPLLHTWPNAPWDRRSSLQWDGYCSQPCMSVSYSSLQPFGMVCAPASANFLHTFTDQHSAEYSRGTLCRLALPCAALLPKFPFCWLSLPCSPWLLAAPALLKGDHRLCLGFHSCTSPWKLSQSQKPSCCRAHVFVFFLWWVT